MNVARNVMVDARLVPGGGAVEMALSRVRFTFPLQVIARTLFTCKLSFFV